MSLLAAALVCIASLLLQCEGGYFPLYGRSFSVLYNDTSGSIPSKRFPDQDVVNQSDYQYFSRDADVGGIFPGENIVVGAKNALYHFDFNLTSRSQFMWDINSTAKQRCINAGTPEYICENHIRTFQRIPSNRSYLLVCGTQGDQTPQCTPVDVSGGSLGALDSTAVTSAPNGLVSYYIDSPGFGEFIDATGTGTNMMDNRYFSAAFTTSNRDFLMSYQNVRFSTSSTPQLTIQQLFRTRAADNFWLRSPVTFVDYYRADYPQLSTAGDREYYFVFLRENFQIIRNRIPLEFIYSRVVRLCRNDPGSTADDYFTSFVKARIFCDREAPSDNRSVNTIDYSYNVITSMAFNSGGRYHENGLQSRAMYGAFIASGIGPIGSAICIYDASASSDSGIYTVFTQDLQDFTDSSNPRIVENLNQNCGSTRNDNDARFLVETTTNVPQIGESPILVLDEYTITQMVVDSQCIVRSSTQTQCSDQDILLMGTNEGTILKVLFVTTDRQIDPLISEEIHLDDNNPIKELKLETIDSQKVLFATTDSKIYRVPLARCSRYDNMCNACIGTRDPYCVWNTTSQKCEVNTLTSSGGMIDNTIIRQNVHNQPEPVYPIVSFSMETFTVSEGSVLTGTLSLDRDISEEVMVLVTSSDGTATAGEDYDEVNTIYTIPRNQRSTSFTVTIRNDSVIEGRNQTFTLSLTGRGSTCVATGEPATVVIIDSNDTAAVCLKNSTVQVGEADGVVMLTVSLCDSVTTLFDIDFYISTVEGTATETLDFSGLSRQRFTIAADSTGSQNVVIPIVNDELLESNERFTVDLSVDSTLNTGNSRATVTIIDNDELQFGFESASYTTVEQDSDAMLSLSVLKIGSNQVPVTISANLVTGSATSGTDYSFSATSVTFDSSTVEQDLQVIILADSMVEEVETFSIDLASSAPRVSALSGRGRATIYIQDNDVVVEFAAASRIVSVGEGTAEVNLTVEASGNLAQAVTVSYRTQDDSATASSDYTSTSGSFQLSSMTPTGVISIAITSDSFYEPEVESFRVVLSVSESNVLLQNNVARVNIDDDDEVTVEFSSTNMTVNEDVGTVTLTVQFLGTSPANPVTIFYTTVDGGATAGMDYAFTSGTLQSGTGTGTITVPITDDNVYEATTESFTVVLSSSNSRVQFVNNVATVSIMDNEGESLAVVHSNSVTENVSYVMLMVTKSTDNEVPVEFVLNTTDITAKSFSDYAPLSSVSFSFPPGSPNSMEVFEVAIIDDSSVENSESFRVGLTSASPRVSVSSPETSITIIDNDMLEFGFQTLRYTVNEGSVLTLSILKQGSSDFPVTLTIAASPDNLSLQPGNVTFAPDETEKMITVNIIADIQQSASFGLSLQSADPRIIIRQIPAVITIEENSDIYVSFVHSTYSVNENAGRVDLMVNRSVASSIQVQLLIFPQTAIDGIDYAATSPLPYNLMDSSLVDTISIDILNDNVLEMPIETFVVVLKTISQGASVRGVDSATVSIEDDDSNTFKFAEDRYNVVEGSFINVSIDRTQGAAAIPVELVLSTPAQSMDKSNYIASLNIPVLFQPSQQSVSTLIPTLDDSSKNNNEKFELTLVPGPSSLSQNLELGSDGSTTTLIEVQDNDSVIGGVITQGLSGTCSPVVNSTSFIVILAALGAVLVAMVVLSIICIICIVKMERCRPHRHRGKRSGIAPFGRGNSTVHVLGNMHASSDGSSEGSPSSSSRSEEKTDLSKGQKGVQETDIDSSTTGTSSMNHVINTTSSTQSSKELAEKPDLSSSPSPVSLPPITRPQPNGNDLTSL